MKMKWSLAPLLVGALVLSSCAPTLPPKDLSNACKMFEQHPSWYWAARDSQRQWGVPMSTQLAIIYQESHFHPEIRPPRDYLLGFIPWFRPTTAFGYTQSLDGTWRRFQRDTHSYAANRDDFADATDFIGWYGYTMRKRLKTPFISAENLYLGYHEGVGGFIRKTYLNKPWLVTVARRVQQRANQYHAQLQRCAHRLPDEPWYHFW